MKNNNSTFLIRSTKNQSIGTSFCIKKDSQGSFLVTCLHVVEECGEEFLEIEGKEAILIKRGSSESIDLALLYVEGLVKTSALTLCSDTIDKGVLFEVDGFKPHKKESYKLEKLEGSIKKISMIQVQNEQIKTYELAIDREDKIEKGFSGSAVILKETNSVIAVATDRNQNGKDAYAIPICYIKDIWEDIPEFISCDKHIRYKGKEKISFLKKMENQALNTIGGVIVMAVITGFIYDALKVQDTTEETVKSEAKKNSASFKEIKTLIELQGGNETEFLKKYFGEDYIKAVENPKTYDNFITLLKDTQKTLDELVKEREALIEKIISQNLEKSVGKIIIKAFEELRYSDVRDLMDSSSENNDETDEEFTETEKYKIETTEVFDIEANSAIVEVVNKVEGEESLASNKPIVSEGNIIDSKNMHENELLDVTEIFNNETVLKSKNRTSIVNHKNQNIKLTYDMALAKSKKENKLIMLYIRGTDCTYSDKMEEETLSESSVSNALETNFITINYNQDLEPLPLGLKEGATPMFIFINSEEDILNMYPGVRNPEEFKAVLEEILAQ